MFLRKVISRPSISLANPLGICVKYFTGNTFWPRTLANALGTYVKIFFCEKYLLATNSLANPLGNYVKVFSFAKILFATNSLANPLGIYVKSNFKETVSDQ